MKKNEKIIEPEFHAVDFMRKVRKELSDKYLQDKEQYIKDLKKALENFKFRQEKAQNQQTHL